MPRCASCSANLGRTGPRRRSASASAGSRSSVSGREGMVGRAESEGNGSGRDAWGGERGEVEAEKEALLDYVQVRPATWMLVLVAGGGGGGGTAVVVLRSSSSRCCRRRCCQPMRCCLLMWSSLLSSSFFFFVTKMALGLTIRWGQVTTLAIQEQNENTSCISTSTCMKQDPPVEKRIKKKRMFIHV